MMSCSRCGDTHLPGTALSRLPLCGHLAANLHTEYSEDNSMIKPIVVWLKPMGVTFRTRATVTDVAGGVAEGATVVTELTVEDT